MAPTYLFLDFMSSQNQQPDNVNLAKRRNGWGDTLVFNQTQARERFSLITSELDRFDRCMEARLAGTRMTLLEACDQKQVNRTRLHLSYTDQDGKEHQTTLSLNKIIRNKLTHAEYDVLAQALFDGEVTLKQHHWGGFGSVDDAGNTISIRRCPNYRYQFVAKDKNDDILGVSPSSGDFLARIVSEFTTTTSLKKKACEALDASSPTTPVERPLSATPVPSKVVDKATQKLAASANPANARTQRLKAHRELDRNLQRSILERPHDQNLRQIQSTIRAVRRIHKNAITYAMRKQSLWKGVSIDVDPKTAKLTFRDAKTQKIKFNARPHSDGQWKVSFDGSNSKFYSAQDFEKLVDRAYKKMIKMSSQPTSGVYSSQPQQITQASQALQRVSLLTQTLQERLEAYNKFEAEQIKIRTKASLKSAREHAAKRAAQQHSLSAKLENVLTRLFHRKTYREALSSIWKGITQPLQTLSDISKQQKEAITQAKATIRVPELRGAVTRVATIGDTVSVQSFNPNSKRHERLWLTPLQRDNQSKWRVTSNMINGKVNIELPNQAPGVSYFEILKRAVLNKGTRSS